MAEHTGFLRSIGAKLGGATLAGVLLALVLLVANLSLVGSLYSTLTWSYAFGKGESLLYEMLFLAQRAAEPTNTRDGARQAIRGVVAEMNDRYDVLLRDTERAENIPDEILVGARARADEWRTRIRPLVDRITATTTPEEAAAALPDLQREVDQFAAALDEAQRAVERHTLADLRRFQQIQIAFAAGLFVLLVIVVLLTRSLSARIRSLAGTADRIARGDLSLKAAVPGSDEVAQLGDAFDSMTASLRETLETEKESRKRLEEVLSAVRETTGVLASTATELSASTKQQTASVQEQSASVYQTLSAADEVSKITEDSTERARTMAETAQRSEAVSREGRDAVEETLRVVEAAKAQADAVAEAILALAERTQAVHEIVGAIDDIADQTNMLALNASIEASRAGENGRGFAIVAAEVKELADQARGATQQARQLLSQIQKNADRAVLSTEEGTKGMAGAQAAAGRAGERIRQLADAMGELSTTSEQIAQSAEQQRTAVSQIHRAIQDFNQVMAQNLTATKQAEQAAQQLDEHGRALRALLSSGDPALGRASERRA